DGDLEIFAVATSTSDPNSDSNLVLINYGTGQFSQTGQRLTPHRSVDAASGDVDGDGDTDVVVVDGSSTVQILLNDGAGNFLSVDAQASSSVDSVEIADLDAEGNNEIVFGSRNGATVTVRNFVDSVNLSDIASVSVPGGPFGVAVGDLNGRGGVL
ncbi:MAG: FG-GAP-like repeat-containing protein, partial [Gimesia chilikensis]